MINVSQQNAVLTIEIDRPDKKNALLPNMYMDKVPTVVLLQVMTSLILCQKVMTKG
jgi:enoyl-CoA hydratase/carnithine racemase